MAPRTLRRISNACLVAGVAGLAFTLVIVGLGAAGTIGPPETAMVAVVAVQSAVNVAAGWNLRRHVASSGG